jgi:glucoamylase
VLSPNNNENIDSTTIMVTGTTTAGATVVAEALGSLGGAPSIGSTTAAQSGDWSLQLPVGFGSTIITVTATLGRSTGYGQRTVINVALPGNVVLDAADPDLDDNGPGTYQYPTAADFHPGAFDLERFRVSEDGTNVYLQATLRNMDPTFGSTFGAQLLDVYVHNPAATSTSSGAAASTFNYGVAPAWSERLEAQGFAPPVWVGPSNASLGNARFAPPDQASRTATLIVPESTFGKPGSGWAFAVALTGQDGFSPDQARTFAPTPQPFQFGVCAPGGTSPICSVDPGTVPKVMDAITPAGVSQATELDPTGGPVVLQGVSIP